MFIITGNQLLITNGLYLSSCILLTCLLLFAIPINTIYVNAVQDSIKIKGDKIKIKGDFTEPITIITPIYINAETVQVCILAGGGTQVCEQTSIDPKQQTSFTPISTDLTQPTPTVTTSPTTSTAPTSTEQLPGTTTPAPTDTTTPAPTNTTLTGEPKQELLPACPPGEVTTTDCIPQTQEPQETTIPDGTSTPPPGENPVQESDTNTEEPTSPGDSGEGSQEGQ